MIFEKYRVSRNIVPTFVLLIFKTPKHLEIPSRTFLNRLFHVNLKTIHFVMIWQNLDLDITKILKGSHLKNQYFLYITESRY